jgi:hypothetical protein
MFLFNKIKEILIGCELSIRYSLSKNGKQISSAMINNNNCVGDIIEQIVGDMYGHMLEKGKPNQSPDYYMKDPRTFMASQTVHEVEIKAFTNNPNFDIGNFDTYIRELSKENGIKKKIFKTIYLIVEYEMVTNTLFNIKNVYAKNVWQLPGYGGKYPLSVQVKQNRPHNIRPGTVKGWEDPLKTPSLFIHRLYTCNKIWTMT